MDGDVLFAENGVDDDNMQPRFVRHLWRVYPVLWAPQWNPAGGYFHTAAVVRQARWVYRSAPPVCALQFFTVKVAAFCLQIMNSWLDRGRTAWRTWWFWTGRSSAQRSGTSPAPACFRSSRTPALTCEDQTVFRQNQSLWSQEGRLLFSSCAVTAPDSRSVFAFHISLLTWRPAGQDEEAADGKHFVRKLTHSPSDAKMTQHTTSCFNSVWKQLFYFPVVKQEFTVCFPGCWFRQSVPEQLRQSFVWERTQPNVQRRHLEGKIQR